MAPTPGEAGRETGDRPIVRAGWPRAALNRQGGGAGAAAPGRFFVPSADSGLPCDSRRETSDIRLADGRILAYDKRKPSRRVRHIDSGSGAFRHSAFAAARGNRSHGLAVSYGELLRRGELAGSLIGERFYGIGPADGIPRRASPARRHRLA